MEISQLVLILLLTGFYTVLFYLVNNKLVVFSTSMGIFVLILVCYLIFGILKVAEIKPIINQIIKVRRKPVVEPQED